MKVILSSIVASATLFELAVAHPCDPEHETHCPTNGPDTLGFCLSNVPEADIADTCKEWVKLHKECSEDFEGKCAESAWSNDAEQCIKNWTKREDLSPACRTFVPEPEAQKQEELTPEQKKRKAERKRIREEAVARARDEDKPKKSKKAKKSKKSKKKAEQEEL